jgi:hypothetical protein
MCPAKFCYRLFGRRAQAGCTPPVYTLASLSSTFFLKSVAHHNICTCPVSGQLKHSEKMDVQPCSDCNSNPQSQRLNKLSAIDHSDTDRRKKCSLRLRGQTLNPGLWSGASNSKLQQAMQHSFCYTDAHWRSDMFESRDHHVHSRLFLLLASFCLFLLHMLILFVSLSLLSLGSLRQALYSTIVSSHQTVCLF